MSKVIISTVCFQRLQSTGSKQATKFGPTRKLFMQFELQVFLQKLLPDYKEIKMFKT